MMISGTWYNSIPQPQLCQGDWVIRSLAKLKDREGTGNDD
jgi:hypothetical protein